MKEELLRFINSSVCYLGEGTGHNMPGIRRGMTGKAPLEYNALDMINYGQHGLLRSAIRPLFEIMCGSAIRM
jgi:hypothetical protein